MSENIQDIAVHTISVYVANKPGVLARIAQVFARRGFNIDSLVVSPSVDGRYSRMTIAAKGSIRGLEQIILHVSKLVDVLHCIDHALDEAVVKEMALLKVVVSAGERTEALQICEHFKGQTVDLTETSMIILVTGNSNKLDSCIEMMKKFNVIELTRTGKVLMARGAEVT